MPTRIPEVGDRVSVEEVRGYKLIQERPFDCRGRECKCGKACHGTWTTYPGVVEQVYYYADNSIEASVMCDDGQRRVLRLVAPHGDLCY